MAQRNSGGRGGGRGRHRNLSDDFAAEYEAERLDEFSRHYRPNKHEHLTLGVPDVVVDDAILVMPVLEEAWFQRKLRGEVMRPIIYQYLDQSFDPFYMTLQVCASCSDYQTTNSTNAKDSLAFYVVQTFGEWLRVRHPDYNSALWEEHFIVDGQLQASAFRVASGQTGSVLIEAIALVYRLGESTYVIEDELKQSLIQTRKYVLAAQFVISLHFQKRFAVTEILVPLYMQDRYDMVNNYLRGDRETQIKFVTYLDQFCSNENRAAAQSLLNKLDVTGARRDKLDPRNLTKALGKLVKKFGVAKEHCPYLNERQAMSTLRFIIHRFYQERAVPEPDFEDMLDDHVTNNRKLQLEAVSQVHQNNDAVRAARLARRWNLPLEDLPNKVRDAYKSELDFPTPEPEQSRLDNRDRDGNAVLFYSPSMPIEAIQFVDTLAKYEACVQDIHENAQIVGIDMEWKPIVNHEQRERLALMQLAYRNKVYLLDFLALGAVLKTRHFLQLWDYLFVNPNILKLGFSLRGDWKVLAQAHETFQEIAAHIANLCDLRILCDKVLNNHPQIFRYFNGTIPQGRSLAIFTELSLGVTLDKAQQWSNWERRPLLSEQTVYAAKDAYVLLDLYQAIRDGCLSCKVDFEKINKSTIEDPSQVPSPNQRGGARGGGEQSRGARRAGGGGRGGQHRRGGNPGGHNYNYRGAVQLKVCQSTKDNRYLVASSSHSDTSTKFHTKPTFVVDNMLQGLGRRLRIFGLDTLILENEEYHTDIVKVALRDGRIVLSSGAPCQVISSMVPKGKCYSLENGSAKDQAAEILKHFEIKLGEEDLFTRCQICNGCVFISIPKEDFLLRNEPDFVEGYHYYNDSFTMNLKTFSLDNGVTVQIDAVSKVAFDNVKTFNVCHTCGKVYWEGSHRGRLFSSVSKKL